MFPEAGGGARPEPLNLDDIDPNVSFDSIGGLDNNIRSLKESIFLPLTYPEVFSKLGIEAPKGVLFYGPPGAPPRPHRRHHLATHPPAYPPAAIAIHPVVAVMDAASGERG